MKSNLINYWQIFVVRLHPAFLRPKIKKKNIKQSLITRTLKIAKLLDCNIINALLLIKWTENDSFSSPFSYEITEIICSVLCDTLTKCHHTQICRTQQRLKKIFSHLHGAWARSDEKNQYWRRMRCLLYTTCTISLYDSLSQFSISVMYKSALDFSIQIILWMKSAVMGMLPSVDSSQLYTAGFIVRIQLLINRINASREHILFHITFWEKKLGAGVYSNEKYSFLKYEIFYSTKRYFDFSFPFIWFWSANE